MEDRRIFERFPISIPVRYLDPKGSQEGSAQTVDLSAKGVGLLTNKPLPQNMPIEMWLKVPDKGEPLYARGEVSWLKNIGENEYRAGVNLEKADLMGFSRVWRLFD